MKRILVVDDHAIVRKGLQQILADSLDVVVVTEARTGEEALNEVMKNPYDLVLLDISLPGRSGIDVLREIKTKKTNLPVLILSIHPEEQYAARALKAGASGYLTKECAPEELIVAIRKVLQGAKYISSSLAEQMVLGLNNPPGNLPHQSLSDREYQVMCLIAQGQTGKEIGAKLSVSFKTVSTYRSRILDKMKMKSNAELTRYVVIHNLIP